MYDTATTSFYGIDTYSSGTAGCRWHHWDWQTTASNTSHDVWHYIYAPGPEDPRLPPTQHLAPIWEAQEIEPQLVDTPFYRLQNDTQYQIWQIKNIDRIDEELRKTEELRKEAAKKARLLLEELMPEELVKLEKDKRLEIVSKNGHIYEILADGRVNKLLPNGQKEGLCFQAAGEWLPTEDLILMKRMLLEKCPEIVEEKANKVNPFPLVS